jgi:hypothetical protein
MPLPSTSTTTPASTLVPFTRDVLSVLVPVLHRFAAFLIHLALRLVIGVIAVSVVLALLIVDVVTGPPLVCKDVLMALDYSGMALTSSEEA